jgi:hypothetical protein
MPIATPKQALAFVRRHGTVTMTRSERPSLVEAVAGGPVKGSWWSHEKGGLIFNLAETLHESPAVLSAKLVEGRVTFVDRALWPALARVVTDPDRRQAAIARLSRPARAWLRKIESRGSVRWTEGSREIKAELERSLLVHSGSVHTERGSHATVLTSWKRVFDAEARKGAAELTGAEARSLLRLKT